jgi:hypothetical protein
MGRSKMPAVILLAVGALQLVLAVVFAVIAAAAPMLRMGFVPATGIFVLAGIGLVVWGIAWWRKAAEAQRVRAEGLPGQAQITGLRQTGLYINHQPQVEMQLQVSTAMHAPYPVTVKEAVPMILLGRLTSGQPLPVMVDREDPQKVVIVWEQSMGGAPGFGAPGGAFGTRGAAFGGHAFGGGGAFGGAPASGGSAGNAEAEKARLLATGVEGVAAVLAAQATGMFDAEGRPVYDLQLQIEVPGHPPLNGPARVGVPADKTNWFQAGARLPIKADPMQPGKMAVDWERMG